MIECSSLFGQNWKNVFTAPNTVSSGFFHNENEGCIGTGLYTVGGPAQIYYTNDGGATWMLAALPGQQITGQVTDIFFRDRSNGWATIKNEPEFGWSGVYKTNDGGRTWTFVLQTAHPTCIRETGRGVFLTDRAAGILRSIDGGRNFTPILSFSGALSVDFVDDNIGIATGESILSSPVRVTLDGGTTWTDRVFGREAWTSFADPVNGRMFFASERDNVWPPAESTIGMSPDNGVTFSNVRYWLGDGITGGMAGSRKCKSVIYVQGQDTNATAIKGLFRSTDSGINWVNVGGPSNYNDTRFAVTGRGAVVYAFDKSGGVWRTTSGGDGTISSSVLSALLIRSPTNTSSAKLCDSTTIRIPLRFTGCEEIRITNISFDSELSLVRAPGVLQASASKYDTLILRYFPQQVGPKIKQISITFVQSDGTLEDTTIAFNVEGLAIPDEPLITTSSGRSLSYGDISVCGGDSSDIITITNTGCAPMRVNALTISNSAFSLLSSFKPFTLDPGTSRKFLVYFKPQLTTTYNGTVIVRTSFGGDSIPITGNGIQGSRSMRLVQPTMEATLCDTPEYILILRNISCSALTIDSLGVNAPFELLTSANNISLLTDSTVTLHLRLVPITTGTFTQDFRIYSMIKGERFDTTITITATITAGAAVLSLPSDVIDFGDVSTCSFAESTISFSNTGCDSLRGNISVSTAPDFTMTGATLFALAKGEGTSVLFTFKPTQIGPQSTTIVLNTNAGSRIITLRGVGIAGGGTVQGTVSTLGTVLTCLDTVFSAALVNNTCDTVIFDSMTVSGVGQSDYVIPSPSPGALAIDDSIIINGVFAPTAGGQRPATATFYFHSKLGVPYQVTIVLDGIGAEPTVLSLSMPTSQMLIKESAVLSIPVDLAGSTILPVSELTFTVETNTDFIEPIRFDLSPQYAGIAVADPLVFSGNSIRAVVRFSSPTIVLAGKLGDLVSTAFITDTAETDLTLTDFSISDSTVLAACLPTSFDSSTIHFALDPNCGDLTISKFIKQIDLVRISGIKPNPSTGQVYLTLRAPAEYKGVCTLEVVDVNGRKILERVIDKIDSNALPLIINGPSGVYQIRVISSGGICVQNVHIVN